MANWTERESVNFVKTAEVFAEVPPEGRLELAQKAQVHHFAAGQTVFRRGETGSSLFVVAAGEVRVTLESPKGEKGLSNLRPGEFFGEIAMMTRAHRTASVTAVGETTLLEFAAQDILALAKAHPAFKTRLARTGAKRSCESLEKLIED